MLTGERHPLVVIDTGNPGGSANASGDQVILQGKDLQSRKKRFSHLRGIDCISEQYQRIARLSNCPTFVQGGALKGGGGN